MKEFKDYKPSQHSRIDPAIIQMLNDLAKKYEELEESYEELEGDYDSLDRDYDTLGERITELEKKLEFIMENTTITAMGKTLKDLYEEKGCSPFYGVTVKECEEKAQKIIDKMVEQDTKECIIHKDQLSPKGDCFSCIEESVRPPIIIPKKDNQ